VRGATREALRRLEQYPWRGNVREVEALVEQAMIFRRGDWILPEDLALPAPWDDDRVERGVDAERPDAPAAEAMLSSLQHEALRIASELREVRRRDLIARCHISREVARRELASLVRLGLLRPMGSGRGARYVPLSFCWLPVMREAAAWAIALV
jgi:DNA-binding NtrC family response regulator